MGAGVVDLVDGGDWVGPVKFKECILCMVEQAGADFKPSALVAEARTF